MMYSDRVLNINYEKRQRKDFGRKFNFVPSPSVRKHENDGPEVLREFLMKSREKVFSPQNHRLDPIDARLDFFDSYKKLPSVDRRMNVERNSKMAYLEKVSSTHLIPKPFGMINANEQDSRIDLHMYSMGDDYAHAFAEGLKHFKNLETLNLRSNRLSAKGSYVIMSTLDIQPIRYLSLCDNVLGEKALVCLFALLRNPKQRLKHLNLENTRLSSNDIISLASIVATNKSLTYLSLAKNNVHILTSKALKEMLHYNESLKKLDLHWNCLKIEGACCVLEGILDHPSLRDLNLSWNAIGNCKNDSQVVVLAKLISKQTTLRHLDLSNNYLVGKECEVIGAELMTNHKILIHMAGNECLVNPRGFIVPTFGRSQLKHSHLSPGLMKDENSDIFQLNNCWICEKWVQARFVFPDPVHPPLFIHLDCDDFMPEMMSPCEEGYFLLRAVPAGKVKFFFSSLHSLCRTNQYPAETLSVLLELDMQYSDSLTVPLKVMHMNFIVNDASSYIKIEEFKSVLREPPLTYNIPKVDLARVLWRFETSMFYLYELPDENYLEDCFEFDWKMSKIMSLLKTPLQQKNMNELLRENYSFIFNCFRYLSCLSGNEFPSVSIQTLNECLQNWKVFDGLFRVIDLGISWSGVISQKEKKNNGLFRHEFLEILVRIANDRYVKNKVVSNIVDAGRKFLSEIFVPNTKEFNDGHVWRTTEYFCEEIDLVYKVYKEVLEFVYRKFSGKDTPPSQTNFMSLNEFREFCKEAKLGNEKLTSKEIDFCFVSAMPVQVDEVNLTRHLEMRFVEFLEAFARCCKTAGPQKRVMMSEKAQVRRLSGQDIKNTLAEVIEDYMPSLVKLCSESIKDNFVYPTPETYKKLMYKNKD